MKLFNKKFPNLHYEKRRGKAILYTENLTPGANFFDEDLVKHKGKEYREFDATRSKLGAALIKKISQIGIKEGDKVLYLGASHGYTPSFISDMIKEEGFLYALDFGPRVVRDLVFLCEKRENMAPILANANLPEEYESRITSVDVVYQDVAQKNQAEIFLRNCKKFLKKDGFGLLAVKSRSIDITKKPGVIYDEVRRQLEKEITIVDYRTLDPLEKDHAMFVVKKK